jgi:phage FluMu gp28-like protein
MQDVAAAFERWLLRLTPYQRALIFDDARFAAYVKARQIGFSVGIAAAVIWGAFVRRRPQIILSASQDLSDEVLDKVRKHIEILAAIGVPGIARFAVNSASEIAWEGRGRVVALPANPRTARSYSGDVWLDEAAYFLDPEGIRDATLPIAVTNDYLYRQISTPNGATGDFYDKISNPPPGWVVRQVDIDQAAAAGFKVDRETLFHTVAGGDERLFGQWFGCKFLDADLQYYPTAMVQAARNWEGELPDLRTAQIFAGLDVGRDHDLTALTIVALVGNVVWHLGTFTCKRTEFREQKALIRSARSTFGWEKLHIDRTGIGRQLAEELVEEFGAEEAIPVNFTNDTKADLVTRGLRWFRDGRVRLERGKEGEAMAQEAIAMRRTVTSAGNIVYDVPRTAAGHGDRLWSFLLALWGAGEPVAPRGFGKAPLMAVP